ncbi:hypothetical protein ACOXXX_17570 [Thalassococcus sp. BH17M4-6]|uniref:hypothetical protein n=1 Tax=Thalassococcus sp. BH17M4-6 TaxID=3413148 RepID=UPI003BC538FC
MPMPTTRKVRRPHDAEPQGSAIGLLFLAGCPLFLLVFHGSPAGILAAATLLALLGGALSLIRKGQLVQQAYDAAEVAYRPRIPYKILGSALIGLLAAILALSQFDTLLMPLGLGVLAMLLSIAAFGADPRRDKGTDNPEVVLRKLAADQIAATERALERIVQDIDTLDDAELTSRTDAVRVAVARLLRALSSNPAELRSLRKPLVKFLQMLQSEVDQLSEHWADERRARARKRYLSRLSAIARAFEARARKQRDLIAGDAFEFETDLLLDRMPHETAA